MADRNITQNQSEHSEFSPISGERDLDCICKCGGGVVIRNVDSREVAGFKKNEDVSEGGEPGMGMAFPAISRDGFRRAGHKSVQVCARVSRW